MKWGIIIYSKHTGDYKKLGSKFNTQKEAREYADKEVCSRCNTASLMAIEDDAVWVDSQLGFLSGEILKRHREKEKIIKKIESVLPDLRLKKK